MTRLESSREKNESSSKKTWSHLSAVTPLPTLSSSNTVGLSIVIYKWINITHDIDLLLTLNLIVFRVLQNRYISILKKIYKESMMNAFIIIILPFCIHVVWLLLQCGNINWLDFSHIWTLKCASWVASILVVFGLALCFCTAGKVFGSKAFTSIFPLSFFLASWFMCRFWHKIKDTVALACDYSAMFQIQNKNEDKSIFRTKLFHSEMLFC